MAEHSSAQNSDKSLTAGPDAALLALSEKRSAACRRAGEVDGVDVDDVYDEMDSLAAQIAAMPATTLDGIRLKAAICREVACEDRFFGPERAWPMLHSIMTDLQRVSLDDQETLRSIFAELAAPLPPQWTLETTSVDLE